MKPSTFVKLGVAAVIAATLASCGASSQLTSSWVDPTAPDQTFKKVVVVGVTPRAPARRMYEDGFVADLQARGLDAVPSYTVAGDGQLDKAAAEAKLQEIGAEAVIVTRLVDQETVQNYYPPTYSSVAAPSAYYGGWYGYYSMGYTYMSSPGYTVENKVFRLETNLYHLKTGKLLWSGLTETTIISGDAPEAELGPLISIVVYDMEKRKVLPKRLKS